MANASLGDIYNRMHSVADYHPFTADTYADWSLEAGDIVTVERNGVQSASPVHTATVRWNGSQRVTLESRGEKEREPVAKMSARAYNSGGNGGGGYRSGYRGRKKTDEDVADLWVESGRIYGYAANVEKTLTAEIDINKKNIRMEVTNREKEDQVLAGKINVQAQRIDIVLTENGKVRAGVIVDAINEDSTVKIKADRIVLDGNTTINDIFRVSNAGVFVSKPMVVGWSAPSSVYLGDNSVVAGSIRVRGGAGGSTALTVADVTMSGNTLTITYADGRNQINFSKAVTLEGAWNGSRKFTVNAYQTNSGVKTKVKDFSTTVVDHLAAGDFTSWDGYWGTANLQAVVGNSEYAQNIGTILVNAYQAYENGRGSVTPDTKTQRNPLYCTGATVIGSGQSDYTFSATLPTGRFSRGNTYDFWREP